MIKTFEQYSLFFYDNFVKNIKKYFKKNDLYLIEIENEILEINDFSGGTYINFYIDDFDYSLEQLLNNFFQTVNSIKINTGDYKEEYDQLYILLFKFINQNYSNEYKEYMKNKQVKKFKI